MAISPEKLDSVASNNLMAAKLKALDTENYLGNQNLARYIGLTLTSCTGTCAAQLLEI
jgi:hypothetical protein